MTELVIKSDYKEQVSSLVKSALEREKKVISSSIETSQKKLRDFEKRYQLSTADFFAKYQKGEMGDGADIIDWAGEYKMLLKLEDDLKKLEEIIVAG
jgi:uncharacterized protein YeeX (DUF496 family)